MKTFDPKLFICSFNGVPLSGFTDGTFIKLSRDEDAYLKKVGVDGEVARARNRNRSGSATFTLMNTSSSNDFLSAQAKLDEDAGLGVGILMVKDLLGTTVAVAQEAWVKKMPDIERGKEIGDSEWVLDTGRIDFFVGGNV